MIKNRRVRKKNKIKLVGLFIFGFFIGNLSALLIIGGETGTHITIIYSSEKASWMNIAYINFMNEWHNSHPNEKITLDMQPYGSSDSMISILNGEIFPTIWSPASSIWMPLLNTKWAQLTKAVDPIIIINESVKTIYSPIVIATWESINQTYNIKGFNDLYNLNLDPNVHLKMAHTDPRLSNSGFMTTIMALSAASGVTSENLTMNELTNTTNQNWLKVFESSAIMYGKSTGFLAKYMASGGPDGLSVAFLYENLIRDISNSASGGKIIAIYPEEGTLYSDHPFCILNADWISEKQREVAQAFLDFLEEPSTVESALNYGFRPINSSISLPLDIFNYENSGIAYNITVPELKAPTSGDVILKIPDLWLLCRATA
ncbi:MAG: substrate-binding domain-containing protein [Candidatus Lokiarchaeota archaeon]|nr:substrate-binding domain-containing protein [Candidatus Lokiarchaeota archaeon]